MSQVPQLEMQKSPTFCIDLAGSCRLELFLFGHLASHLGYCSFVRCWVRVSMTELVSARGTQRGGSNPGRRVTKATVGECGTKLEDTRVLLSKPHGPNQQPVWIPSRHLKPYHKPDAE
ncbi:uncharacterized protein LOC114678160 [Macaca mulatta]